MNKFYSQIDKALLSYEENRPYHALNLDWICNRISWCWKWKKISAEEKDNLCERTIEILKNYKGEDYYK